MPSKTISIGLSLLAGALVIAILSVALRTGGENSENCSNPLLEEWQTAVLQGDVATMKRFPTGGIAIDAPVHVRRLYRGVRLDGPATALIVTAAAGDIEAAEYLLHVYADVNATDANGNTPLHAAVAASELEVVSLLLKHGADVNAAAGNKRTPLIRATAYGDESIAIELINAGANVNLGTERNLTPLMYAAMNGQTELCRLLLQNGAKVDASENDFGWTAHIHAARHGQVEVMQVLESAGADPRQKDNRGADSLYHAALNSGIVLNSLKYLLSQGADPNTATSNGATPLHEAARVGPADAVILLYEAGGSLEVSNNRGETPLDVLRNRNDEEAKRALEVLARHPVEKR